MASELLVTLIDDIDGSSASHTVQFGLDGATYEIDLNDKHAEALRSFLGNYIQKARKVGLRPASRSRGKVGSGKTHPAVIRAWAIEQGYDMPKRGRLPGGIVEAYEERVES